MKAEWIAVDWGASRLRVWAMQGEDVIAERVSDNELGNLNQQGFELALRELVEDWIGEAPVNAIVCGMLGAGLDWAKAPYNTVPASPLAQSLVKLQSTDPRLQIYGVPGLGQDRPADVMHREETLIAGFLSQNENWDGVICLPGPQTKWVHISANEVVSFQTFMTGEIFDFLSSTSELRHSIGAGWDKTAFFDAMDETLSRPETFAAKLFSIRAQDLLEVQGGEMARARLSGLLVGVELAAARPYWLGQQIAMISADSLMSVYAQALERQGAPVVLHDEKAMTIAGLIQAKKHLASPTHTVH